MNEVNIIKNAIEKTEYYSALSDVVSYLSQPGNGIKTIERIVKEVKEVKNTEAN